MTTWKQRGITIALIGVIFGAGLTAGMAIERTWLHTDPVNDRHAPMPPDMLLHRLSHELQLEPSQIERIQQILEDTSSQARDIWKQCEPEMRALRENTRALITPVLSSEQAAEYERISEAFERRHRKRFGGRRGPPRDPRRMIERLDRDGDGQISRGEAETPPPRRRRRLIDDFQAIDTDGDARLSEGELQRFFDSRGPRPGDPHRPPGAMR